MRMWILCADNLGAKIFLKNSPEDEACLCHTIPYPMKKSKSKYKETPREFIQYVVEEIEIACGSETGSGLILCADSKILTEYFKQFSQTVKSSLVGTIDRNLFHVSPEHVSRSTRSIHERAEQFVR